MNDKKYNSSNKQDEEAIKRLEKQLEKIKELRLRLVLMLLYHLMGKGMNYI